ncbi:hypothetical protein IJ818_06335 [bacterium]|nr:hypothetical protein [bacterium]
MDIIKNLKDYKLSHKQRIFASYLKDNADSYTCVERITNREYMRKYFAPDNDLLIYSTAFYDPSRICRYTEEKTAEE